MANQRKKAKKPDVSGLWGVGIISEFPPHTFIGEDPRTGLRESSGVCLLESGYVALQVKTPDVLVQADGKGYIVIKMQFSRLLALRTAIDELTDKMVWTNPSKFPPLK